jgi:hypothetical protein
MRHRPTRTAQPVIGTAALRRPLGLSASASVLVLLAVVLATTPPRDGGIAAPRDRGIAALRDRAAGIGAPRDCVTAALRDRGAARPRRCATAALRDYATAPPRHVAPTALLRHCATALPVLGHPATA